MIKTPRNSAWPTRSALSLLLAATLPAFGQVNVLTYHNDFSRTGQNTNETILTPANVNANTFGKVFSYPVDGQIYAQPLYVSALAIPGQGTHNVIFVATMHDSVYAFDADSNVGPNGGVLWQVSLGTSAAMPNNDFGNRYGLYHDIRPEVGIIGTPVIDLAAGTIYLSAFTHEGNSYIQRIHALSITTGAERPFSPVVVAASIPATGVASSGGRLAFNPMNNGLQRPALTLAGGVLYVCYSGFADTNPYHGWLLGFNPSTLQQPPDRIFTTPTAPLPHGEGMPAKAAYGWVAMAPWWTQPPIFSSRSATVPSTPTPMEPNTATVSSSFPPPTASRLPIISRRLTRPRSPPTTPISARAALSFCR